MREGYDKAVDWWALGIFIFELTHGYSPFRAETQAMMFEDILLGRIRFRSSKSLYLRILLANILHVERQHRFGSEQIKQDLWFADIDWEAIFHKQVEAPGVDWDKACEVEENEMEEFAKPDLLDATYEEKLVAEFKDF